MEVQMTPPSGDEAALVVREEGESTATTLTRTAAGNVLTPVTVTRRRKERKRAVPLLPEVRHFKADGLEVRSSSKTDEIFITGSPVVYDTSYEVRDALGSFSEVMAPGVAADVLSRGADVRFLLNHDGLPLARSTAGTMTLKDTPGKLTFTASLDARQQLANDLAIAIERGDVSQMSCGFVVARDEWDEDMENRTILAFADLLDISAVTYPASPTTAISIAHRMAMEIPVESRARARKIYAEIRAGKVLSTSNQDKLVAAATALSAVLESAGFNPDPPEDEAVGETTETPEIVADEPSDAPEAVEAVEPEMAGVRAAEVDPGEAIRASKLATLRVQMEARNRRRKAA